MDFLSSVKQGVEEFRKIKNKPVRIISHLDSDGLTSAAILIKTLKRAKTNFAVSIVKQIDELLLKQISLEPYEIIFFVDLGSSSLELLEKYLKEKKVFVLDHHTPDKETKQIIQVNPHLWGIDGGINISGSGVAYLFSKIFDERNVDLAYLAVIGAIGDMQERNGFSGLNKNILEDAINNGKLEIKKGPRMFGVQTKPLHKILEYSTDPYIPGVTGDEFGAKKFLEELGIEYMANGRYRKITELGEDEVKKLVTGLILKRLGSENNPDDVLGIIYTLREEEESSPMRDAREFSTLLNSCGRLNKQSVGIGACLGDEEMKEKAIEVLQEYRKELIGALNWFYASRGSEAVREGEKYVIINAADNVRDTLIGTLVSILSKSNFYKEGTILLSMAYKLDGNIKVSVRAVRAQQDLISVMKKIVDMIGCGVAGGHKYAAGALVPQEKEEVFINAADQVLKEASIEERI